MVRVGARRGRKKLDFNGYSFDDKEHRRLMKFVVITAGDLDLNGAYGFKSRRDLNEYLKEYGWRPPHAIFEVKDITPLNN